MAEAQYQEFDRRMRRIVKRHRRLANGYVTVIDNNGLVVAKPRRQLPGISWTAFVGLFLALLAFKAFLFASLGPETYAERVAKLANGTVIEQMGAVVMQPEPVTLWLVEQYKGLL